VSGRTSLNAGRLIALEGTHGPDLAAETAALLKKLSDAKKQCGLSRWDASNTFFEMRFAKSSVPPPSPHTLLLLYASDLAFRLRWEIRPAMKEGKLMIAAPYVETAAAFGAAVGIPKKWLADLFSFAPQPEAVFRIGERKKRWHDKCKPGDGFIEFCCSVLANAYPYPAPADLRGKSLDYLDSLEEKKACRELKRKAVAALCGK
jgi:hypothetical protein